MDEAESKQRPIFHIGQHDSKRDETAQEDQVALFRASGFSFITTPITNQSFRQRVVDLYEKHLKDIGSLSSEDRHHPSLPGPVVPPLTPRDTSLFPNQFLADHIAYSSPWIDLSSSDPVVSSISRQVLNLEVAYASFTGIQNMIVPGPRTEDGRGVAQYARALREALKTARNISFIIHIPMYREPGLEENASQLSHAPRSPDGATQDKLAIDLFGAWESWNTIRSLCDYHSKLSVALRVPHRAPEFQLQTRWFSEPVSLLTFGPNTFQQNRSGHPSLSKNHQSMINMFMRLRVAPSMLLYDVGPARDAVQPVPAFPTLAEAQNIGESEAQRSQWGYPGSKTPDVHVSYLKHLEAQQEPLSYLERTTLIGFQDWLQSPLQPLSDNLESATYEVFETDPVKYDNYERALVEAMSEWKELGKATSWPKETDDEEPQLVVAVAGAGRGPLMTRAIRAAEQTGWRTQLWALEKNQNAYVYLLRRNQQEWGGRVNVIKTDMREWRGPEVKTGKERGFTKVDILVSELLGSFGDNELSPECLDGIQHHLAQPHGISIPSSYTAHLTPISTPRIHADLKGRSQADETAFETPWVVRLFQHDFVCERVPGQPRFQQAWEFVHPHPAPTLDRWAKMKEDGTREDGVGAMYGSAARNEHNARHTHLAFVCRSKGVIHGLAGYFEATLYKPQIEGKELVELSILPEMIDKKSRDMVSWFPIFFPLKNAIYFPEDTELTVSMWRQTDDTRVWYEWLVEAYAWVGEDSRVKVGSSELHSSYQVACKM